MSIPFDQFQRYKTLSEIVKQIKVHYNADKLTILEIGANEQRNLEKFLPDEEIFFSDIELPEELLQDCHFFIADATNLERIEDEEYDIVLAGDVFEHIPREKREAFLKETSRVAKYASVFCCPFNEKHVCEAEKRSNEYFKTICGEDYVWLKEHIENGLPDKKFIDDCLESNNISYVRFEHGDIRIWEELTKCHFYSCFIDYLIPYCDKIDDFYNFNVYANDISELNYRVFYIMYKNENDVEFYNSILDSYRNGKKTEAYYERIEKLCREIKEVFGLHQKIWLEKFERGFIKNAKDMIESTLVKECFSIYFDMGDGYSLVHMTTNENIEDIGFLEKNELHINVPLDCISVRIDPIEGQNCVLKNIEIVTNKGVLNEFNFNGIRCDKYILFNNDDPWIEIMNKNISWIQISADVILFDGGSMRHLFGSLIDEIARTHSELENTKRIQTGLEEDISLWNSKYKNLEEEKKKQEEEKKKQEEENDKLRHEIGELTYDLRNTEQSLIQYRNECDNLRNQYNAIENAFFWRITKPFRKIVDILSYQKKSEDVSNHEALQEIVASSEDRRWEEYVNLEEIDESIRFSILVPLYNTQIDFLCSMLDSVVEQKYQNWELCLADGSDDSHKNVEQCCLEYATRDCRIKYRRLEENKGISENTNECAKMASGEYIVLFDHDDYLSNMALYENALAIQATKADVLYSDEDHITEDGRHICPFYKPDWSRDLLYSQMYICHLLVFRKDLFEEIGGFRSEYDGSQDYDLMLRFSEKTEKIFHIPRLLYSWRECDTSTAKNANSKLYANDAGLNALDSHLKRRYGDVAHAEKTEYTFVYEARFDMLEEKPLVSIIIPMRDHYQMTNDCIESILKKSSYENYEIIILDNQSKEKKTKNWLDSIVNRDSRIRVLSANFEFNWSKLNNFGMENAQGEVYIFLNNDILVISEDWIERLCENALRTDIGVVGPLLLYEDNTIQHAGVLVGFGGWADHIFKGMEPIHNGTPYVSPMLSRNVTAVTGACMAISKKTIDRIGGFDESFIVTGSDVEICLRAYENGLNNLYNSRVRLYHLESKSRDPRDIPQQDFERSYECYTPYRENGDPYYNVNLDYNSYQPKERDDDMSWVSVREYLKNNRFFRKIRNSKDEEVLTDNREVVNTTVAEVQPIMSRAIDAFDDELRINILCPSVDQKHVFGGIATALSFYEKLSEKLQCYSRIIVTDAEVCKETSVRIDGYHIVMSEEDSLERKQVVPFCNRAEKSIPVAKNDIFIATGWWTAYTIEPVLQWQASYYNQPMKHLVYMIQDFEPGFYPWSSRYLMADSTYKMNVPTIAVFNSKLLYDYFLNQGYSFAKSFFFEPVLNSNLKEALLQYEDSFVRKKQILIYGRPHTDRNAFELIVSALKDWVEKQNNVEEWKIYSAGEAFADIPLGHGMYIQSLGKLSLEDYAKTMLMTSIGISLMVSPHPSYPPLEMSTFGIKTITNCYGNKDLSTFNDNVISLKNCSQSAIANELLKLCDGFKESSVIYKDNEYFNGEDVFAGIITEISNALK